MEIELDRVDDNLEAYHEFPAILRMNQIRYQNDANKKPDGYLQIQFKDTEDRTEPFPEQLTALNYFNENQSQILMNIAERFFEQREDFAEAFGQEPFGSFPVLSTPQDIWKSINLSSIYLHKESHDGCSFVGLFGDCPWDPEHALGIVMHKDKVLLISDWSAAYYNQIDTTVLEPPSVSSTYSLDRPLLDRNPNAVLPDISTIDVEEYAHLFDWLEEQKAIRGYRQTPANISSEEKTEILLDIVYLELGHRKLHELPSTLGLLINLLYIDLSVNSFKLFPEVLCSMNHLESINLSFNNCETIPRKISNLTNLEHLDLSNNHVRSLPSEVFSLPNLKELDLDGNKMNWIHKLKLRWMAKNKIQLHLKDDYL
jgi:hypothetical protein